MRRCEGVSVGVATSDDCVASDTRRGCMWMPLASTDPRSTKHHRRLGSSTTQHPSSAHTPLRTVFSAANRPSPPLSATPRRSPYAAMSATPPPQAVTPLRTLSAGGNQPNLLCAASVAPISAEFGPHAPSAYTARNSSGSRGPYMRNSLAFDDHGSRNDAVTRVLERAGTSYAVSEGSSPLGLHHHNHRHSLNNSSNNSYNAKVGSALMLHLQRQNLETSPRVDSEIAQAAEPDGIEMDQTAPSGAMAAYASVYSDPIASRQPSPRNGESDSPDIQVFDDDDESSNAVELLDINVEENVSSFPKLPSLRRTDLANDADMEKLFDSTNFLVKSSNSATATADHCIPLMDINVETGEIVFLEALESTFIHGMFKVKYEEKTKTDGEFDAEKIRIDDKSKLTAEKPKNMLAGTTLFNRGHSFKEILRLDAPKVVSIMPSSQDALDEYKSLYGSFPGKQPETVEKVHFRTGQRALFHRVFLTRANNLESLSKNVRGSPAQFDVDPSNQYDDPIYVLNLPLLTEAMCQAFSVSCVISSSIMVIIPSNVDHPCKIHGVEACFEAFATMWDPTCKVEEITDHIAPSVWVKSPETLQFVDFKDTYDNEDEDSSLPWGADVLAKVFNKQWAIQLAPKVLKVESVKENSTARQSGLSGRLQDLLEGRGFGMSLLDGTGNSSTQISGSTTPKRKHEDDIGNVIPQSTDPDFKPEGFAEDWNAILDIYGYSYEQDKNDATIEENILDTAEFVDRKPTVTTISRPDGSDLTITSPIMGHSFINNTATEPQEEVYECDKSMHSVATADFIALSSKPNSLLNLPNDADSGLLAENDGQRLEIKDICDNVCVGIQPVLQRMLNCKWPLVRYPIAKTEEDFAVTMLLMNPEDFERRTIASGNNRRQLSFIEWYLYARVMSDMTNKGKKITFEKLAQMLNHRIKNYLQKRILTEYDSIMKSMLPKRDVTTGRYIPFASPLIAQRNQQTISLLVQYFGDRYEQMIMEVIGEVDNFGKVTPVNGHARFYVDRNRREALVNVTDILKSTVASITGKADRMEYATVQAFDKDFDDHMMGLSMQGCYPELLADQEFQALFRKSNERINIARKVFNAKWNELQRNKKDHKRQSDSIQISSPITTSISTVKVTEDTQNVLETVGKSTEQRRRFLSKFFGRSALSTSNK